MMKHTLATLALAAACPATAATLITSDAVPQNDFLPANYGDNIVVSDGNFTVSTSEFTGTPDIALDWVNTGESHFDAWDDWNGRGGVIQIDDDNAATDDISSIMFIPSGAIMVKIISFALDEWAGGGNTIATWSITGPLSGTLASGTFDHFSTANDPADAGGRVTLTPDVTGAISETLSLNITQSSGDRTYLAIDSISFDQSAAVPEPSSALLLGLGGLSLLRRRRK